MKLEWNHRNWKIWATVNPFKRSICNQTDVLLTSFALTMLSTLQACLSWLCATENFDQLLNKIIALLCNKINYKKRDEDYHYKQHSTARPSKSSRPVLHKLNVTNWGSVAGLALEKCRWGRPKWCSYSTTRIVLLQKYQMITHTHFRLGPAILSWLRWGTRLRLRRHEYLVCRCTCDTSHL